MGLTIRNNPFTLVIYTFYKKSHEDLRKLAIWEIIMIVLWWPIYTIMNSSSFINTNPIYSRRDFLPAVKSDSFISTLLPAVLTLLFCIYVLFIQYTCSLTFSSSMSSFWLLTGHNRWINFDSVKDLFIRACRSCNVKKWINTGWYVQIVSCHVMKFFLKVNGILWFEKRICDVLFLEMFTERGANLLCEFWILLILFFL